MEYTTKSNIIVKQVLNENTGEIESKQFREEKTTKTIRGGYNMIYHKSYEEVMEEVVKSNKDLKLFNWITNRFTYQRVESPIIFTECKLDISQPSFSKMVKLLNDLSYLLRVGRGIYRLNPFIYVPFRADASSLQQEWTQIKEIVDKENNTKEREKLIKELNNPEALAKLEELEKK